jgi:hypothetical protein
MKLYIFEVMERLVILKTFAHWALYTYDPVIKRYFDLLLPTQNRIFQPQHTPQSPSSKIHYDLPPPIHYTIFLKHTPHIPPVLTTITTVSQTSPSQVPQPLASTVILLLQVIPAVYNRRSRWRGLLGNKECGMWVYFTSAHAIGQ